MSNLVIYHTGFLHGKSSKSLEVCKRIQEVTGLPLAHVKDYDFGTTPIVYGAMRGTAEVMQKAYWSGVGYFYVDNGYTEPGHFDGNYRVCYNKQFYFFIDFSAHVPELDALIVIMKPSYQGCQFLPFNKVDPEAWTDGVLYYLHRLGYTNLLVKTKLDGSPPLSAIKYDALVAHDSAALYQGHHDCPVLNVTNQFKYNGWVYPDTKSVKQFQWKLKDMTPYFTFNPDNHPT